MGEDSDGNGAWDLEQPRTHNKANEITAISATTGSNWADPTHDRAGNMTTIPQPASPTTSYAGTWDPWNRLVKLMNGLTTVGEYAYDGMVRRTKKVVSGTTRHSYYSRRWQVLEERIGSSNSADRQFVWGQRYIDELVLRDRDADEDSETGDLGSTGSGLQERIYALQDGLWNCTTLVSVGGSALERQLYTPFGFATTLSGSFTSRGSSSYGWELGFQGYCCDLDTCFAHVRHRILHPVLGRWLQAAPHFANNDTSRSYWYVGNRVLYFTDPSGQPFWIPIVIIVVFVAATLGTPDVAVGPAEGEDYSGYGPAQDAENAATIATTVTVVAGPGAVARGVTAVGARVMTAGGARAVTGALAMGITADEALIVSAAAVKSAELLQYGAEKCRQTVTETKPQRERVDPPPIQKPRQRCKDMHPDLVECYELHEGYIYGSADEACKAVHGRNAKADVGTPSTEGKCQDRGGTHHDCRVRSAFKGTASCCPCCEDTPNGPLREYKCTSHP